MTSKNSTFDLDEFVSSFVEQFFKSISSSTGPTDEEKWKLLNDLRLCFGNHGSSLFADPVSLCTPKTSSELDRHHTVLLTKKALMQWAKQLVTSYLKTQVEQQSSSKKKTVAKKDPSANPLVCFVVDAKERYEVPTISLPLLDQTLVNIQDCKDAKRWNEGIAKLAAMCPSGGFRLKFCNVNDPIINSIFEELPIRVKIERLPTKSNFNRLFLDLGLECNEKNMQMIDIAPLLNGELDPKTNLRFGEEVSETEAEGKKSKKATKPSPYEAYRRNDLIFSQLVVLFIIHLIKTNKKWDDEEKQERIDAICTIASLRNEIKDGRQVPFFDIGCNKTEVFQKLKSLIGVEVQLTGGKTNFVNTLFNSLPLNKIAIVPLLTLFPPIMKLFTGPANKEAVKRKKEAEIATTKGPLPSATEALPEVEDSKAEQNPSKGVVVPVDEENDEDNESKKEESETEHHDDGTERLNFPDNEVNVDGSEDETSHHEEEEEEERPPKRHQVASPQKEKSPVPLPPKKKIQGISASQPVSTDHKQVRNKKAMEPPKLISMMPQ